MTPVRLMVIMASVFALSPLAIDLYLPTFPAIAQSLGVPSQDIALTISIYILGLSLGQFLGGPLSDYQGRRPVLFVGLAIFCVASVVLAISNSVVVFWGARFVQALGGGFASVVVPAMIRDRTEGQETAKLFAMIGLITIIAPALAPALGTLLFVLSGWRLVFFTLAAYAALVGVLTWRYLHVAPAAAHSALSETLLRRYRFVLGNPIAMRYLLAQGLAFGVMMVFLANAPLVYIEQYGASEAHFSLLFAANVVAMAVFNRINHYLLNRIPSARILAGAVALQCVACLILVAITGFAPPLWAVVPLVMLAVGSLGAVMGNAQACMLQFFPRHSGIAAALMGSGQYLLAALVSALSTQFHSEQMWPMTVAMALASVAALSILPSYGAAQRHLHLLRGSE